MARTSQREDERSRECQHEQVLPNSAIAMKSPSFPLKMLFRILVLLGVATAASGTNLRGSSTVFGEGRVLGKNLTGHSHAEEERKIERPAGDRASSDDYDFSNNGIAYDLYDDEECRRSSRSFMICN